MATRLHLKLENEFCVLLQPTEPTACKWKCTKMSHATQRGDAHGVGGGGSIGGKSGFRCPAVIMLTTHRHLHRAGGRRAGEDRHRLDHLAARGAAVRGRRPGLPAHGRRPRRERQFREPGPSNRNSGPMPRPSAASSGAPSKMPAWSISARTPSGTRSRTTASATAATRKCSRRSARISVTRRC
jgi:hypothetical protein